MTPDDIRGLADNTKTGFIDWYSKTTLALRVLADVAEAAEIQNRNWHSPLVAEALARVETLKR